MKASRELDYLIAEKIFDLTCLHDPPHGILLPVDLQVKNYSTQIADAWLVVEKFAVDMFVYIGIENDAASGWRCSILPDDAEEHIVTRADTAPLAICLAALKATEDLL